MTPRHILNDHTLISRTSIFHDFPSYGESGPSFQGFPLSPGNGVDTIGISVEIIIIDIENESNNELGHEITWDKGGPGMPSGGTPPRPI